MQQMLLSKYYVCGWEQSKNTIKILIKTKCLRTLKNKTSCAFSERWCHCINPYLHILYNNSYSSIIVTSQRHGDHHLSKAISTSQHYSSSSLQKCRWNRASLETLLSVVFRRCGPTEPLDPFRMDAWVNDPRQPVSPPPNPSRGTSRCSQGCRQLMLSGGAVQRTLTWCDLNLKIYPSLQPPLK